MTKREYRDFITTFCMTVLSLSFLFFMPEASSSEEADTEIPSSYDFKTITYNICGLPDLFTYDRNLAPMKKRFDYIGEKLKAYDIIGLQEAFVGERRLIEDLLGGHYVAHGTDIGISQKVGSGIYTFARWPIWRSHYERWRKTEGPDALSLKGFVMATVRINKEFSIDVYNLHGQAGGKSNFGVDNMYQLTEAMRMLSFGSGRPILLIGDFNCKFWDDQCTVLIEESGVQTVFPEQKGVDHIFYHENNSGWKISVLEYRVVFDEKLKGRLVSDHKGFETIFRLEKQ